MSEPNVPPPPSYTPPPPPSGPAPGVSQNRTLMIVLSYLPPLCLIPLLVEKEDKEVQWHAKHGLVLMIAWVILAVGMGILTSIVPPLGCIFLPVWFVPFILHVICIIKGVNGDRFVIPVISQYADRF